MPRIENCFPCSQFPYVGLLTDTSGAFGDCSSFDCVIDHIESWFKRYVEIRAFQASIQDFRIYCGRAFQYPTICPSFRRRRSCQSISSRPVFRFGLSLGTSLIAGSWNIRQTSPVAVLFTISHSTTLFRSGNISDGACLSKALGSMTTQPQNL